MVITIKVRNFHTFAKILEKVKGVLYLIPSPLGDGAIGDVIPNGTISILKSLNHFVVEELRSARRYLSRAGLKGSIERLNFALLNEHTPPEEVESLLAPLLAGESVGLISEAGLPAVADPGSQLVALAHKNGIDIIPLVGPSSLMLALMASGKNGQNFAFVGYLPIKGEERAKRIKELERLSYKKGQSQLIIEAPYRNEALLAAFLQNCNGETLLTIATNITTPSASIRTKTIAEWREESPQLNKKPTVFIL